MDKKIGCGTVVALLFLFGMIASSFESCMQPEKNNQSAESSSNKEAIEEPFTASSISEPEIPKWQYSYFDDEMTSKKISFASIQSLNQIDFDFPYQGAQRAMLQLRKHPRYGKDVILSMERGQFLTSFDGTTVLVRFDDGAAQRYRALEPSDHDSKALFIQGYSRFYGQLKKASIVKIEAQFYHEGNRVFEFDVKGIDF